MGKLIGSLQTSIPVDDAKHTDWFHFARGWAELILLASDQAEAIPEQASKRIKNLQAQVKERFPAALEWEPVGLPEEDCLALLAPARQAFVQENKRIVSHGGISVEELIVPLVRIERANA